MRTDDLKFGETTTVAAARTSLVQSARDTEALYVVGADGRLTGSVGLKQLFQASDETPLRSLARSIPAAALAGMDQEHVAALAAHHGMSDVPVVDEQGRFLGIVPASVLIRVVRQEHVEDMHKLAGIIHEVNYAAHAFELSPWRRVRGRLPWLVVGLAGSGVAASVMAAFEQTLAANLTVAFFVPVIVYLADAIGTQTEAVAIRGLSLSHAPLTSNLVRELSAGLLIGLALAALAAPCIAIAFGDWRLAAAVSLSIVVAGGVASTIGLALPWALSHAGFDPAFGSGPVATVIQDVLSLIVYFSIVAVLLPNL